VRWCGGTCGVRQARAGWGDVVWGCEGKLESRPTVTRLSLGCLILVRSLI